MEIEAYSMLSYLVEDLEKSEVVGFVHFVQKLQVIFILLLVQLLFSMSL